MSIVRKKFIGIFLCAAMLCPLLTSTGCATKTKNQSPVNVFSMPKWKKEETKSNKVKKDPNVPVTMGEAMMGERVSVL
jgi:hypothetical protein